MNIAILGATSHIAKGLILHFSRSDDHCLHLFARSEQKVNTFLDGLPAASAITVKSIDAFKSGRYDVVINCVGIGSPAKLTEQPWHIFGLTESFDNLIIDYLSRNQDALYINFSSGAVYGTEWSQPACDTTALSLDINHLAQETYYLVAKINSEAKHRSHAAFHIMDLRVFAYFSRFADLEARYFLSEIITCIKMKRKLITDPGNMVRDYIHPHDLFSLVTKCMEKRVGNDVFDVFSAKPASKFEILDFFQNNFGLEYAVSGETRAASATGRKDHYYSTSKKARLIGYQPLYSSLDCINTEARALLEQPPDPFPRRG